MNNTELKRLCEEAEDFRMAAEVSSNPKDIGDFNMKYAEATEIINDEATPQRILELLVTLETQANIISAFVQSDINQANKIEALNDRVEVLKSALWFMSADMHCTSSRGCPTCKPITELLGKPFGCYQFHQKVKEVKHD